MDATENLIATVLATAEVCGTTMNPAAARLMIGDLSRFPHEQVMGALRKCRRELRGKLTLSDILTRIDDGRPGSEEAWAMIPAPDDEDSTVIQTDEMLRAMEHARKLEDSVARRMAFKETYTRLVQEAREMGRPVVWTPSLGRDPNQRAEVLAEAVQRGRIGYEQAAAIVGPTRLAEARALAAPGSDKPLPAPISKLVGAIVAKGRA